MLIFRQSFFMFLIAISSFIILPTLFGLGYFFEKLSKITFFEGVAGKLISGIFGVTLLWSFLAFFVPLNIFVEIPTILFGFFFFFYKKLYLQIYNFTRKEVLLFSFISFIVLFCASFYPFILDHFGYYVPTINWLTEYGLVKGISNLEILLAQTSFWHIFQAGFSNFSDPFLRINAIILIIYSIYIIEKKIWILLSTIPILLLFTQSPSPDLPVIVFSLIALSEIILKNKNSTYLFAFSVFVFAIKPTMIWLPILSFLYTIFITKSSIKKLFPGCIVLIIYFVKNLWIFGYPFFPISIIDFNLPWKTNFEVLKTSSEYAINKTFDNQYTNQQIANFTIVDSIKNWLFIGGIKTFIHISFILSLIGFCIFSIIKKNKIISFICISILIKSCFVLLFSAQYRFFIDVFFVIFFVILFKKMNRNSSISIFSILSFVIVLLLSVPKLAQNNFQSFNLGKYLGFFSKEQIFKPSTYEYKKYDSYTIRNLNFNISHQYPFNFDTPTPSISASYILDYKKSQIFPQLIDKNDIRKGFVWKKLNKKEQNDLQNIIEKLNKK